MKLLQNNALAVMKNASSTTSHAIFPIAEVKATLIRGWWDVGLIKHK
jgi:hypothetical protein